MRSDPSSTRRRAAALLLAVVFALAPAAGALAEPFDGSTQIRLGDQARSAFLGTTGEAHHFAFYALEGAMLSASVQADPRTTLQPTLRLARPGGDALHPSPVVRHGRGSAEFASFRALWSGWYVLEVEALSGTGAYTLATRGAQPRRLGGMVPRVAAGAEDTWSFYGVEGARLSARVSGLRAAKPQITGLVDPSGVDVGIAPKTRGRTSAFAGVVLPATGRYRLAWRNVGGAGDLRLSFAFRHRSEPRERRTLDAAPGAPGGSVYLGEPDLDARPGYVGSKTCGACHGDYFLGWADTAHNNAVRPWNQPGLAGQIFTNDVNSNGRDDFRDGLDLATQSAWAAFGANAPKLSYVAGDAAPYKVRIGTVTYDVHEVMGGNGLWKSRYVTRVGRQRFILPVQWNDRARTYATYDPADWYDGTTPLFTAGTQIPKAKSFEARCSGCHNTGETLTVDAASGDFLTGFVEMNIGCEQCHGPGEEHAKTPDRAKIQNPRRLLDGTAAGVAAANAVCARCHTRGESIDPFPGTTTKGGFGYDAERGVQQLGDAQTDFFVVTTKSSDFWSRKTDPVPSIPGDTFLASKSHRQQGIDLTMGGHAPTGPDAPTCFECHDMHGKRQAGQVATTVDRGVALRTRTDDNTLCLSCHARNGLFAGVSESDVAAIATGGSPPASVVRAVVDHMKEVGMPVDDAAYDPKGTGVGRCDTCHMTYMGKTAAYGTDAGGFQKGDLHAHTFQAVWPNAGPLHNITNSCNSCHPTSPTDTVGPILTQWATKGADADSTFHADVPRSYQNGTANPERDGGVRCAGCHTTEGFVRIQVKGETLAQGQIDAIVKESLQRDMGITCAACHGRGEDGQFAPGKNPLRIPKNRLCGSCHNNETVRFEDFRDHGEMVRHPQREMLLGTSGAEVPGTGSYADSLHSVETLLPNGCVDCHYDTNTTAATHDFQPKIASCRRCHDGLATFNRPSRGDYDGDGMVEGVQDEVSGLLDHVRTALLLDPSVTHTGGYFDYAGATDHAMTGATEAQKRAAFNWYTVTFDKSRGVHNLPRTVELLQRSYREVTGFDIPGAAPR